MHTSYSATPPPLGELCVLFCEVFTDSQTTEGKMEVEEEEEKRSCRDSVILQMLT